MKELLQTGLQQLNLEPNDALITAYLSYIELLIKWNKAYNLTAITRAEEIVSRHILDSLSVIHYIKGDNCLDVGTGAGLPGLILALAQPYKRWTLLDSNQKKLRFIQHVKGNLNIKNVEIVHARVEEYQAGVLFHSIICRAYSSLIDFYSSCRHLLDKDGRLLAMKAKLDEQELAEVKPLVTEVKVDKLELTGPDIERCLVSMSI